MNKQVILTIGLTLLAVAVVETVKANLKPEKK